MNSEWLQYTILRAASWLAPAAQRSEWLEEWRCELWFVPRRRATLFCLGAFQDALWLRRNHSRPVKQTSGYLKSPVSCLAFLAILAAAASLIAVWLPVSQPGPQPAHLRARDLPEGCIGMLLLSGLALPAIRLAMGSRANRCPMPWPGRLRRGIFLSLKIALLQPILFGGFVLGLATCARLAPLGFTALWIPAFHWVLIDQRRRCPVCLRLLGDPVRIGTPSQTFLAWYGAESICSHGHGLLHVSETSASYSAEPRWLNLDDSWSGLFSQAAGMRQI